MVQPIVNLNRFLTGAALIVTAALAHAAPPAASELLGKLVQCKAPIDDVVTFNELLDSQQIGLKEVPDVAPFGAYAWKMPSAVSTLGANSDVAMINGRHSFYLIVATGNSKDAVLALAKREDMKVPVNMGDDAIAQKDGPGGMYHAYTIDRTHYAAGCNYDEGAYTHAVETRVNASPARVAQKKQMQSILNQSQ